MFRLMAMTAALLAFAVSSSRSYAQLIPTDVAVDINRRLISPRSVTFNNSEITLELGTNEATILKAGPPATAASGTVVADLSTLSQWSQFSAFQSYLLSLPGRIEMLPQAKAAVDLTKDSVTKFAVWKSDDPQHPIDQQTATITAHYEKNLIAANNAFVPHGNDPAFDPDNAIFFRLSGFEADVPEVVFWTAQSSFVNGLVTRLILGEFEVAMRKSSAKFKGLSPLPKVNFKFPRAAFEGSVWPTNKPIGDVVRDVLRGSPIQGDALLYGWYAGDALAQSDAKFKQAVWNILRRQYDARRIGQMVGYTLSYLEGYSKNIKYARPAGTNPPYEPTILNNLAAISAAAGQDAALRSTVKDGVPPTAWLSETLFEAITDAQYDTAIGAGPTKNKTLGQLRAFLQGFNQGAIRSANVVYADTFLLAYGIGYEDGFSNGYAKGYAEGFRVGYAQGVADSPQGDFFGNLGAFLGDVEKVASIVSDVMSIVALL